MEEETKRLILDARHPPELIDIAEKDARENIRGKYHTAEWIAQQSSVTLTVLLAGIGGSLAYASKLVEPGYGGPVSGGAAAMCAYLVIVAGALVVRCLIVSPMPAQVNEPAQWLYSPGLSLDELKRLALVNLQARIDEARTRNERIARALNQVRIAALATPVAFVVGAAVSAALAAESRHVLGPVAASRASQAPAAASAMAPGSAPVRGSGR